MQIQLLHFKFITRASWLKEPFVDWYSGETEAEAREVYLEDLHRYGIKPQQVTTEVIQVAELP